MITCERRNGLFISDLHMHTQDGDFIEFTVDALYHGTCADLNVGDVIESRPRKNVNLAFATADRKWATEWAKGKAKMLTERDGVPVKPRVYQVVPLDETEKPWCRIVKVIGGLEFLVEGGYRIVKVIK